MAQVRDLGRHENDRLRSALAKIAEIASEAANGDVEEEEHENDSEVRTGPDQETRGCVIKQIPARLLVRAAETARKINPANAPVFGPMAAVSGEFRVTDPMRIAVLTSKYWGPTARKLTVSFMEHTASNLKTRIISHMNAWGTTSGISFVGTNGTGNVRISRRPGGYWSYLGTDILLIPKNRPTMNLAGFSMSTPESEYRRVVRHETGHTLGFPHEHMRKDLVARIDPDKAYKWFWETYGWDKDTVDSQVLTPLDEKSLMATPVDQTSIMCYQLPGTITVDGNPITGGADINQTDYAFAGKIYPRVGSSRAAREEDWEESEDVDVAV